MASGMWRPRWRTSAPCRLRTSDSRPWTIIARCAGDSRRSSTARARRRSRWPALRNESPPTVRVLLGTRASRAHYHAARERIPELQYHEMAHCLWLDREPERSRYAGVVVIAAGTSDLPVLEEVVLTLDLMGHMPLRVHDVGVAGLHRLAPHVETLQQANVVVVVAGMEGALASVVGGITQAPVIAVPTSVGYGASFGGLAALLAMLNSCATGVAVVNIDNGYGAGHMAATINERIVTAGLRSEEGE